MNEIVKYENRINTLPLTGFSAVELDLFMALCAKTKEKGQEVLTFSYNELKTVTGLARKTDKYFHDELYKMSDKMVRIHCHFANENEFVTFNLFSTFRGSLDKKELTVRVNKDFEFLLNELTKNFTRFELSEFVKLESKYSKSLYRILKQYRKTGTYTVEAEKFRELMDCPKSYENIYFMRDCVNVAVKELSQGYFEGLKVEPIRGTTRGRPVVAYTFTFKPSKQIPGQMNLDDYDQEPAKPKRQTKKQNRFNNFHQREYDYDDLEKGLLQGQRGGQDPEE